VFFVSHANRRHCRQPLAGLIAEHDCRVVYNGLDLTRYGSDEDLRRAFRVQHGIAGGTILIGAACAFRSGKQLDHLFQLVAGIPNPDVKLLLAGFAVPGDEHFADELLARAHALLNERLVFTGSLTDLRGFLNALDLYVNTSKEESFGMSVLEALACGCPVVGYPSKAVEEVVLPDGGEIVPQDDQQALLESVSRWLQNPAARSMARPRARQQAERFDLRRISEELWAEYDDLFSEIRNVRPSGQRLARPVAAAWVGKQ
jgi:glycosyltransferase involved in cell wall biosynthesis